MRDRRVGIVTMARMRVLPSHLTDCFGITAYGCECVGPATITVTATTISPRSCTLYWFFFCFFLFFVFFVFLLFCFCFCFLSFVSVFSFFFFLFFFQIRLLLENADVFPPYQACCRGKRIQSVYVAGTSLLKDSSSVHLLTRLRIQWAAHAIEDGPSNITYAGQSCCSTRLFSPMAGRRRHAATAQHALLCTTLIVACVYT